MTPGTREGARPAGRLAGRLVALGVTGSIAAYKAPEVVRRLRDEGAEVVALLTPSAARFVAPLALEAVTGHAVDRDVTGLLPDGRIGHIVVADAVDAILVAPATAHWLAAMANGLAADPVTAACLATTAPVVVAPAMDGEMYAHPATRTNVRRLRDDFGYLVVEPESGPLASGQSGVGRLPDATVLVDAVVRVVAGRPVREADPSRRPPASPLVADDGRPRDADLEGRHVVVTAGGTVEPIDPVRVITNRSTGRMGVAVAEAALDRGARVTLIAANVTVPLPERADVVRVETTADLRAALLRTILGGGTGPPPGGSDAASDREAEPVGRDDSRGSPVDALVMAAAVSDFRPARPATAKIARGDSLTLTLEPTPDLLAEISSLVHAGDPTGATDRRPRDPRPVLVGFAAETGSLDRAPGKLRRKRLDLLVANDVSEAGSGFGTETNRVTILAADGTAEELPLLTKRAVADQLLDRLVGLLDRPAEAGQTDDISSEVRR